jgi:hypothetical protein
MTQAARLPGGPDAMFLANALSTSRGNLRCSSLENVTFDKLPAHLNYVDIVATFNN